jgi:hypothetical protein
MIALTNHALDHMLCSVLDANITNNIVRLGSRSADERISQYSIETKEMVAGQSRLNRTFASRYRELKVVQGEITQLMNRILSADLESDSLEIVKYLQTFHPEHHEFISHPPEWIRLTKQLFHDDSDDGWQKQGRGGRSMKQDMSIYAHWKNSGDLEFLEMSASSTSSVSNVRSSGSEHLASSRVNTFEVLISETGARTPDTDSTGEHEGDESDDETPLEGFKPEERWMIVPVVDTPNTDAKEPRDLPTQPATSESESESESAVDPISSYINDPAGFFVAVGEDDVPSVPSGDRPLDELLDTGEVWAMSRRERKRLHGFWIEEARIQMHQNQLDEFERLRKMYAERVKEYNEGKEEVRLA